jgi:hypothetical protein
VKIPVRSVLNSGPGITRPQRPERETVTCDDIPKLADLLKHGGQCPVCGYIYQRHPQQYGINNGVAHRAWHRQHVPLPDPRLADFPATDIRVDQKSPPWLHQLVYQQAHYLQQQEHYDFTQWDAKRGITENECEKDIHALLLIEEPQLIVGAASWSWVLWNNHTPSWCMNFIWIAGTWRRKGVLSKRWPIWRETYGAFIVEPPWSESMEAFLRKMGVPDPAQAAWLNTAPDLIDRCNLAGPEF